MRAISGALPTWQLVGGVFSSSGDVTLGQGFWSGATPAYNIYLPLVIRD
jgi:hypothetical protein